MDADWNDLRVFLTLAREGSLTAAARRLGVSHPTVSRRVRALEESFGTRLFDRLPDKFVLTAAGEGLLEDATAMERAAESLHRRSAGLGDTVHGTVRLSAGEAMSWPGGGLGAPPARPFAVSPGSASMTTTTTCRARVGCWSS